MVKYIIASVYLLFSLGINMSGHSQTLQEKWNKTMERAENYEVYKVIKKAELSDLWKSVQDSVSRYKSELVKERANITVQKDTITQLHNYIDELRGQVTDAQNRVESIGFMGAQVNKYAYTTLLWIALVLSLLGSAVLFFMFYNSNRITKQAVGDYAHLSTSFDEYKTGKIEMERKLRREIQTHVNKLEELRKK